jgi:Tfp pilus assembly protein PilX
MNTTTGFTPMRFNRQRGVVLFFALIALLAMSLAAVALIRSVDTSTLIAGNLSFRQSATSSGDGGIELANALLASNNIIGVDPTATLAHPANITNASSGYYSYVDDNPASPNYVNLFADATWNAATTSTTDGSGNTYKYVVQRMCRTRDGLLSAADCLVSDTQSSGNSLKVKSSTEAGGNFTSSSIGHPAYRLTIRTTGPKNTVSYIQAFAY